jgi:glycosyltransferase A (GT-A) superfamily protein (DUF2064 family)
VPTVNPGDPLPNIEALERAFRRLAANEIVLGNALRAAIGEKGLDDEPQLSPAFQQLADILQASAELRRESDNYLRQARLRREELQALQEVVHAMTLAEPSAPEKRLGAILDVARELRRLVNLSWSTEAEIHQATSALVQLGMTWHDIGQIIGMSASGAQRRYAGETPQWLVLTQTGLKAATPPVPPGDMSPESPDTADD